MKISICQINTKVGDLFYNTSKILKYYDEAVKNNIDLAIFPELSLTGYPIKDLANNQGFLHDVACYIEKIIDYTKKNQCALLIGAPLLKDDKVIHNTALLIQNGRLITEIYKTHLPNYSIFDESRNFNVGSNYSNVIQYCGEKIGILICEDIWYDDIAAKCIEDKASILIAINASPFDLSKHQQRYDITSKIAKKHNISVIYTNAIGGQDEFIFDGGSFAINQNGNYILPPDYWKESQMNFSTNSSNSNRLNHKKIEFSTIEHIYQALMLALRDYVSKNGFKKTLIGLSGGIDSALTSVIIVDAIGSENLRSVMMPSKFNQKQSLIDAKELVNNLGCKSDVISISDINQEFLQALHPLFSDKSEDVTEENLQARIRAVILMAISNKFNELLISTSNKSESAVGYTTLYGDMSGSFALIKDIYKTQVYELAKWRNKNIPKNSKLNVLNVIPQNIIDKEPSAELRYDQKDSDSLPKYEILDKILYSLIEQDLPTEQIASNLKTDSKLVTKIHKMLIRTEFKRDQAPIGPKITTRSLGSERRYPITISTK